MEIGMKKERQLLGADIDEKLDRLAKALLTNPLVQAFVINHACTEFLDLPFDEVKKRIQTKRRRVDAEAPVALEKTGNLEDAKANVDSLFEAESPLGAILRLNIEMQDKYQKPSFRERCLRSTARLFSSLKAEAFFSESHDDELRKEYSIWICLDPPAHRRGCLVQHSFVAEIVQPDGSVSVDAPPPGIDKVCVVEICLAKDPAKQPDWMKALAVLFNTESTPEERLKALEENGVKLTEKETEEFMEMFADSKCIREQECEAAAPKNNRKE